MREARLSRVTPLKRQESWSERGRRRRVRRFPERWMPGSTENIRRTVTCICEALLWSKRDIFFLLSVFSMNRFASGSFFCAAGKGTLCPRFKKQKTGNKKGNTQNEKKHHRYRTGPRPGYEHGRLRRLRRLHPRIHSCRHHSIHSRIHSCRQQRAR